MYFLDGVVYYSVKDVFHSSLHGRFLQTVVYWFAMYFMVFVITIPFVYRYFMICR